MFALAPRSRTYPVLLPDRPSIEREPARRRTRRRPLPTIVAVAVIAVLPALTLVSPRTAAARTGYVILGLRQQVEELEAEHARLVATASALRAPDRTEIRRRARDMTGVVCVALSVLALRLAQLQVIQGGRLQHLAQRQQREVIAIEPHRSLIFDRRGRPLAINVEATSIYAVPSAIADRQAFAARVAPLLGQRVNE